MLHSAMTAALGNHLLQAWEVANAAALTALTPVAADIGKVAYQSDTREFYILANNVGPVWKNISGEQLSGTFTPTLYGSTTAGANTYSTQTGFYRKQGSIVHVQGRVTMTAKDGAMAGDISIGALPFTPLGTANSHGPAHVSYHSNITYPASKTGLAALILAGNTGISLRWSQSAAGMATVVAADIMATTDIIFGATYISA